MNNFFASIYESLFGLYDSSYALIFDTLFDEGGYIFLGVIFILIPFLFFALFYFSWNYPYGKFWHWLLWLIVTSILVSSISWGISYNEIFFSNNQELNDALADPNSGYEDYALTLPIKYALFNGILGIVVGFLYSLILKQFSKIQIHLPF